MPVRNWGFGDGPRISPSMHGHWITVIVDAPPDLVATLAASGKSPPVPVVGLAILDTGSTTCGVDEDVVSTLGLQRVAFSEADVYTPAGVRERVPAFSVKLTLPDLGVEYLADARPAKLDYYRDFDHSGRPRLALERRHVAFLGWDFLSSKIFVYHGIRRLLTLAWRDLPLGQGTSSGGTPAPR